MKKFKKIIALSLVAMSTVSAVSMTAMASELSQDAVYLDNPTQDEMVYYADNRIDCYGTDADGGTWSIHYYDDDEIAERSIMPANLEDRWADNVWIPITNIDGTHGVILGENDTKQFTISPDSTIHITVGDLDDTMPHVNVSIQRLNTSWYKMMILGSNGEFSYTIPSSYRTVLHQCTASSNTNASYAYFEMWTDKSITCEWQYTVEYAQNDTESIDPSIFRLENQKNTEERGFIIREGAIYDLSGQFLFNVSEEGQLSGGEYLDENFRVGYVTSEWSEGTIDRAIDLNFIPVLMRYGYVDNINRYEFAAITYNMLVQSGKLKKETVSGKFADTDSNEVNALAMLGIISGRTDTQFSPDENILREEAAAILARVADYVGITAENKSVSNYDDDSKISSWAKDNVYKVKRLDVMQGERVYDAEEGENQYTNLFNPRAEITKEESIVTVMRIYDMLLK